MNKEDNSTKKLGYLAKELVNIYSLLGLDYQSFRENNKISFFFAKDQVIRGKVMFDYAEIDGFVNMCFWFYFFPKKNRISNMAHYKILVGNKRCRMLYDYVLPHLGLRRKIELLKRIVAIPRSIEENIRKIVDLRNKLAHYSTRFYFGYEKIVYKNRNIFSSEGLKLFLEDSDKIQNFIQECHYNISKHTTR